MIRLCVFTGSIALIDFGIRLRHFGEASRGNYFNGMSGNGRVENIPFEQTLRGIIRFRRRAFNVLTYLGLFPPKVIYERSAFQTKLRPPYISQKKLLKCFCVICPLSIQKPDTFFQPVGSPLMDSLFLPNYMEIRPGHISCAGKTIFSNA